MLIINRFRVFHPLTCFILGYLLWMFVPAFFTEKGHHLTALAADVIGVPFIFVGYALGAAFKKGAFKNKTLMPSSRDMGRLVVAFMLVIYPIRLMLFSEVGIYAFLHPFSRESSLLDTVCQQLTTPFIVLLMVMYYSTRKGIFLGLLFLEVILFIVPTMARSYYFLFPMYYLLVIYFYGRSSLLPLVRKFIPMLVVVVVFIGIFGPFINDVRSYATIGDYESGLALDLRFEEKKTDFLINRLNIHGEAFAFEPVIHKAVAYDQLAFESMAKKWFGGSASYDMHPSTVSNEAGLLIDYGVKTSTDLPRNYVLINYEWGVGAVILFNLFLGMLLGFVYKLIFDQRNGLFLVLWIPFILGPAFSSQGAFPSTFLFQHIFLYFSFSVLYFVFFILKYLVSPIIELGKLSRLSDVKL